MKTRIFSSRSISVERKITPKRKGTRILLELSAEPFSLILQMQKGADFGDAGMLRKKILKLFDNMKEDCKKFGWDEEDVTDAQYPLCAFIDEIILESEWRYKEDWLRYNLTVELYNDHHAGEGFFRNIKKIEDENSKRDILEIYLYCMLLGFEGEYKRSGTERLNQFIENISEKFTGAVRLHKKDLSPNWKRPKDAEEIERGGLSLSTIIVACFIVAFLFYLVLSLKINSHESALFEYLANIMAGIS